jgi:hypothetical protein
MVVNITVAIPATIASDIAAIVSFLGRFITFLLANRNLTLGRYDSFVVMRGIRWCGPKIGRGAEPGS